MDAVYGGGPWTRGPCFVLSRPNPYVIVLRPTEPGWGGGGGEDDETKRWICITICVCLKLN